MTPRPRSTGRARLDAVPAHLRPLVAAQLSRQPSRRSVLRGAGLLGLGAALSACGTAGTGGAGGGSGGGTPTPARDRSQEEALVRWSNWTLYLDLAEDGSTYPTLEAFTAATGIEVEYSEDVDGNDTYYGKVQGQLAQGKDIGADIMVLTDWMAARCIRQGYVQPFTDGGVPNKTNILPDLADVDFDPGRERSLTWQSGFAGIAWKTADVPFELTSVSDLWRPELKGRVEVLDEMRDTMGLIMLEQGVDISSGDWGEAEFGAALEVLEEQISNGQIRQVRGNSYKEDLVSGDALAVIGWSGDLTQLNFENDDQWTFRLPDAGGALWSDNMLIPVGSPHRANAQALMDHYYDPEVAAQVAAYVNYICPVQGAREAMEAIDPELVDNELIFPSEEVLANAHVFRTLDPQEEQGYNEDFQRVIGN